MTEACETLYAEAATLAGRPVEVEQTSDGKFIALWMEFERPPPEKGDTEKAALENFISYMQKRGSSPVELPPADS